MIIVRAGCGGAEAREAEKNLNERRKMEICSVTAKNGRYRQIEGLETNKPDVIVLRD
jgi:hypothetical protein